jgi:integrase
LNLNVILSTAQDLQQMAGQVFRYAVQTGRIEQNPVLDLKVALKPHTATHFAATLDPVKAGDLLRAIDAYAGQAATVAALQLSSLFFQRLGNVRALKWAWIDFESHQLVKSIFVEGTFSRRTE